MTKEEIKYLIDDYQERIEAAEENIKYWEEEIEYLQRILNGKEE